MGLEKVKQEILEKAKGEAAAAIDAANAEARAIMKSAEKQIRDYEKTIDDDIERTAEVMKRREVASAELEVQKQALSLKNELINSIFSEARKKLGQLTEKGREAHIKTLLDAAFRELDAAVIRCSHKDAKFVQGRGKVKIVEDDSIGGGIIAESSDGRLRVDYSYDTLLEQARAKVLSDVARTLFGK